MSLEIKNLQCQIEGHNYSPIIGLCIEENCNAKNKFTCSECIFEEHSKHKIIRVKEVDSILTKKLEFFNELKNDKDKIMGDYSNLEESMKNCIEQLKSNTIKLINEKINLFFDDLKNKFTSLIVDKNKNDDFDKLEEFISSNAAPASQIEIEKLSKICYDLYKKGINIDLNINNKLINKKIIEEMKNDFSSKKYDERIKNIVENDFKSLDEYLKQKFLNLQNNILTEYNNNEFEWSEKTYSNYQFYYILDEERIKAEKNQAQGKMTIIRSKQKLENGYKYIIESKIGYSKGGDYDIGIGTEEIGVYCWLRKPSSSCICNLGILNNGYFIKKGCIFKDGDIIKLEANFLQENKVLNIYVNNQIMSKMNIDLKDDIYFMFATRNIGNSIEVINYKKENI